MYKSPSTYLSRFSGCIFFSLFLACGNDSSDSAVTQETVDRIVNGSAKGGEFQEVNELYINFSDGSWGACTGTWIGLHKILTAAHCVTEEDAQPVAANAVTVVSETDQGIASYRSIRIDTHPNYSSIGRTASDVFPGYLFPAYDIAVVTFAESFAGMPALLSNKSPLVGDTLALVGFGLTGEEGSEYGIGNVGQTKIDYLDSHRIFWDFEGGDESNTCLGDSGGPAYIDFGSGYRLVGITSGGTSESCSEGDLSFDMRIDAYLDWLVQITEGDLRVEYFEDYEPGE